MKSKIMKIMVVTIGVLAVVALSFTAACAPKEEEAELKTLKIGCPMAFSGPASAWGLALRPSMDIYAELINEDGGIKIGDDYYKIELYYADDEYTAEGASRAGRELVYTDKVDFVLGYWAPNDAEIAAVTEPEKIIFFAHGTVPADWDATEHPYTFMTNASIVLSYGQPLAIVDAYPDTEKVGFLVWENPQVDAMIEITTNKLETVGVDCVSVIYPIGTSDFTTYLAKLYEEDIDTLFHWSTVGEFAMACKQGHEAGYDWHYAQPGTMIDVDEFIDMAGYDAAQDTMSDWPCPWVMKKQTIKPELLAMAHRIADRYEQEYGEPMTYMGGFGYGLKDMTLLFDALQRAGTTDPDEVQKVLWGGTFDTFIGRWTFHGEQTYKGPVALGYPCCFGKIEGRQLVYAGEAPVDIP